MSMKPLKTIANLEYKSLYLASIAYVLVAIILGIILSNGLVIFLGWNMVLATVPLILSQIYNNQKSNPLKMGLAFLFVLFFPNTIYILTDFIHFQNYTFFIDYPSVYAFQIIDWIVFTHILIGGLLASKIGVISIKLMLHNYENLNHRKQFILISTLFILSSIAIFIGRFLRFNSWDIFKIEAILNDIFNHFTFFIQFIGLYFIIHWVVYLLFLEKKEPKAQMK